MAVATRTTMETFLATPDFDERRLELIDGEVFEKAMPTWEHGRYALRLGSALDAVGVASVEPRAIIPASPSFDASSPLPDVAFYRDTPPARGEWMTGPPHVAIEIMSRGQTRRDMRTKVELYLAFGVESIWIVDPRTESVEIYEGGSRRVLAGEEVIATASAPGFAMSVADLFRA